MTLNALRRLALGLACALALAGCGSDGGDGTTPDVPADVQALGSELVQTASTDPLTDLKDLLPPEGAAALSSELMPPS